MFIECKYITQLVNSDWLKNGSDLATACLTGVRLILIRIPIESLAVGETADSLSGVWPGGVGSSVGGGGRKGVGGALAVSLLEL